MILFKDLKKIKDILSNEDKMRGYLLILLITLAMFLEMLGVGLILPLLQHTLADSNTEFTLLNSILEKFFIFSGSKIYSLLVLIFIIFLIKGIFLIFVIWYQMNLAYRIQKGISEKIFFKYISQPLNFHISRGSSSLIHNISFEINYFIGNLLIPLAIITSELFIIFGLSTVLILINFKIFIIVLVYYTLTMGIYINFIKKKNLLLGLQRQKYEKERSLYLQDTFLAIKDVKSYSALNFFSKKFIGSVKNLNKTLVEYQTIQHIPSRVVEIISVIAFLFVFWFMYFNNYTNSSIVINLGIFALCAFKIMPSLNRVISNFQNMKFGKVSIDTIHKELNLNYKFKKTLENKKNLYFKYLNFKNISLKYTTNKDKSKTILNNINLKINRNDCIGIIGESGSGKSTLLNLVLGLIEPSKGEIEYHFDDASYKPAKSQTFLGYVPQEFFLLNQDLFSNIGFGLEKNEIERKKVIDALNKSGLKEFAEKLKTKKNFKISDRGQNLSGGQRQRIAIARALYFDPAFLVFDEITSALDKHNENRIINMVKKLKNKKTILISSHSVNSLGFCDKIYKVSNGKLIRYKFRTGKKLIK